MMIAFSGPSSVDKSLQPFKFPQNDPSGRAKILTDNTG